MSLLAAPMQTLAQDVDTLGSFVSSELLACVSCRLLIWSYAISDGVTCCGDTDSCHDPDQDRYEQVIDLPKPSNQQLMNIHEISFVQESQEGLPSLKKALRAEHEAAEQDKITIFAPSNDAFEEVSGVVPTLDYATLSHVRCSVPFLS